MKDRSIFGTMVFAATLALAMTPAGADDASKYPDWGGQWFRTGGIQFDPSKPLGRRQEAPLTPEYQALFDKSLGDLTEGGAGLNAHTSCVPHGMPRMMNAIYPMEFVITPQITYLLFEDNLPRRIYTDARDWPAEPAPSFAGFSIGRWVSQNGDGRYDLLEVETRYMKGPRTFEGSGLPLHEDNETVVKERISLAKDKPDILVDEITTIDHALTRPWTVTKTYKRKRDAVWYPNECAEDNHHIVIGKDHYFISADGLLMPAKKDQAPPDTRYFRARK